MHLACSIKLGLVSGQMFIQILFRVFTQKARTSYADYKKFGYFETFETVIANDLRDFGFQS